ncbi:MAG: hypothetical protein AAGJ38_02665 [Planctomycetota bacterium]
MDWTGRVDIRQPFDHRYVANDGRQLRLLAAVEVAADLDQLTAVHPDDEALYDLKVVPLLHSELNVFAEADPPEASAPEADNNTDTPAAYIEADLASCLPPFAFVNGEVREYNANHELVSEHRFESSLWGMFRTHRETLVTDAGPQHTTQHNYFWLFTHETR